MAGSPNLYHAGEDGIHVAVCVKGFDILIVAASFALEPKLLAASAVVGHFTCMYGRQIGFFVHICLHENRVSFVVLYNYGNHAI